MHHFTHLDYPFGTACQKNKYALQSPTLRVLNVLNVDAYRILNHDAMLAVFEEMLLGSVPQLGMLDLDHTVDDLVAF